MRNLIGCYMLWRHDVRHDATINQSCVCAKKHTEPKLIVNFESFFLITGVMNFNSVFLHLLDMILKFYTKKEIFRTNILKESYTRFSADSSFFLMKKNQRKNCLQAQIMIQIEKLFFCLKDRNIALHLNAKPYQDSSHEKNLTT